MQHIVTNTQPDRESSVISIVICSFVLLVALAANAALSQRASATASEHRFTPFTEYHIPPCEKAIVEDLTRSECEVVTVLKQEEAEGTPSTCSPKEQAELAIAAADPRRTHLAGIYAQKKCNNQRGGRK